MSSKFSKVILSAVALLLLMPAVSFARDRDEDGDRHDRARGQFHQVMSRLHLSSEVFRTGTVTAVSDDSLTLRLADGSSLTVNIDSDTRITQPFIGSIALSDITLNSTVVVKGAMDDGEFDAKVVVMTKPNERPVKTQGTVTAVSGNTVTVESEHRGVEYSVTVETDGSTTVSAPNGEAGTTADIDVGAEVKVAGFWDSVRNILEAVKIKILK